MNRRSARIGALLVAGLAAGTACSGSHRVESAAAPSILPPAASAPSTTRQTTAPPVTFPTPTASHPYRIGPTPAVPPGALAGWVATSKAAYSAQIWYRGVLLEHQSGRLVVVYPALILSSDGTRVVAHVKLPVFSCARRAGPTSPNFVDCHQRRVEYGDLAKPTVSISVLGDQELTVAGQFPTYTYGVGVDRGPALSMQWTGHTFPVRLTVMPAQPLRHRRGGLVATGQVQIGEHTAVADLAYPGVLVLPKR